LPLSSQEQKMRVIVMGAGVIGTSTAYYLACAGAQVRVLDRQPAVAQETSFGNAGQISPGYSTPWAAPGLPLKAVKWLFQQHSPLAIRPDGTTFQWEWMLRLLSNCTAERYAVNKARMMRLAEYSRDCLRQLRADTGIAYEHRSQGTLQLFRSAAQLEAAQRDVAVLQQCGVPYQLLSPVQLLQYEPALAQAQVDISGALRLPGDETGDCQLFTQALARQAETLGVRFDLNCDIQALQTEGGRITGVQAGGQLLQADRYVLALGSYSRPFLQPLGLRLPVYPVKGYSLTIPLRDAACAPVSTVLDESFKVAVTRFAQRIRVGGMAELAGFDLRLRERRRATLEKVVGDLFPGAGHVSQASFWTGLRPMTPDGTPIIGATAYDNLYLNTGHGTLGWTMACGSGKLLADQLLGRAADIDTEGLSLQRYEPSRPASVGAHALHSRPS